jgi:nicotinamidase-related amidase
LPTAARDAQRASVVALLLIDVINDFEWPGAERAFRDALPMARRIAALKRRARRAGVHTIYVNDNFGRWTSDFKAQVRHVLEDGVRGRPLAELLLPDERDHFVLKPRHSGFFHTPLDLLLDHLRVRNLILTGVAANNCVLFTASDAYLLDYEVRVPRDCVVSNTRARTRAALAHMADVLKADTRLSTKLRFT